MRRQGWLLIALLVASCQAPGVPTGPSPLGGTWTAIAAPGMVVESNLEAARFQFSSDLRRLTGVTNCTEFSVPVSITNGTFVVGEFAFRSFVTCTARDHEIENAVVAALRDATEISGGLPGDRLYFRGPKGELVLAQPMPEFPGDSE